MCRSSSPASDRAENNRRRVQHLRLTLNHIQASLDNIMRGQLKQENYLRQRNELMGRREDVRCCYVRVHGFLHKIC